MPNLSSSHSHICHKSSKSSCLYKFTATAQSAWVEEWFDNPYKSAGDINKTKTSPIPIYGEVHLFYSQIQTPVRCGVRFSRFSLNRSVWSSLRENSSVTIKYFKMIKSLCVLAVLCIFAVNYVDSAAPRGELYLVQQNNPIQLVWWSQGITSVIIALKKNKEICKVTKAIRLNVLKIHYAIWFSIRGDNYKPLKPLLL